MCTMNTVKRWLLAGSWRLQLDRLLTSRKPVVLLYHGIPKNADGSMINQVNGAIFEEQIQFLQEHFELIAPDQLCTERGPLQRQRVLITFDDGFRNNAEVAAPLLRRYQVPALFFVCNRHATPGKYLWFVYLDCLRAHFKESSIKFRGETYDMSDASRNASVQRLQEHLVGLRPHPEAMYRAIEEELPPLSQILTADERRDWCDGMSEQQVAELAADPLFEVGIHTVDHPYLTLCEPEEALRQMRENKIWLERVTGKACPTVSYPLGDYNRSTMEQARAIGCISGHAVAPQVWEDPAFEVARVGIYSPSLDYLGMKAAWGNSIRALRLPVS